MLAGSLTNFWLVLTRSATTGLTPAACADARYRLRRVEMPTREPCAGAIAGRHPNQNAAPVPNHHLEPRRTVTDHTGTFVWHDTGLRYGPYLPVQPLPVTDAKNMENDENKPVWEKNSRGFWLTVCLMLSAVAGWVMFHLGILH